MFKRLTVKNLAVVEGVEVSFGPGLNVLTGETGAGKSVLMGALHLLLGERTDRTLIRTGATEASVSGVFSCTPAIDALLNEEDLPACEEGELIIRRTFNEAGNGKIRVNDTPVTATFLRRMAPLLADIHGPHDQLALLDEAYQLTLLTAYSDAQAPLAHYQSQWQTLQSLKQALMALTGGNPTVQAETYEQLTQALQEIQTIAPTDADGDELIEQHALVANAETILAAGNQALDRLTEGEQPIVDELVDVQRILQEMATLFPEAKTWADELSSLQMQLQELSQCMSEKLSTVEADPEQLLQLEARMAQIQRLKRKYGGSIATILTYAQTASQTLAQMEHAKDEQIRLQTAIVAAEKAVLEAGKTLQAVRQRAAEKLSQAITEELQALGFTQAAFPIRITTIPPTPQGIDRVTFCFEPNPGETARPLAAIASSGEIARVMLAIKSILARHSATPTLVFDEIDANIGGETGRKVGEKLRRLAAFSQVICITHQPQAAVFGHTHLRVYKQVDQGHTSTHIDSLSTAERIDEIARMLGGKDLTSVTIDHAREMLLRAKA